MYSLNLLHSKILVNVLHTVPWTFPMVLLKDNFCNNHFNPLTPTSDQDRISSYNIYTKIKKISDEN